MAKQTNDGLYFVACAAVDKCAYRNRCSARCSELRSCSCSLLRAWKMKIPAWQNRRIEAVQICCGLSCSPGHAWRRIKMVLDSFLDKFYSVGWVDPDGLNDQGKQIITNLGDLP